MVSPSPQPLAEKPDRLQMADIAAAVGCSISTVSRALRPETAHLVKEQRRLEILQAVRQMNFLPNRGASTLRRQEISSLTVVIPNESGIFTSDFYGLFLGGIFKTATENGLETTICPAPMQQPDDVVVDFSSRAEAFIYLPRSIPLRRLHKLIQLAIPVVVYRGSLPFGISPEEIGISTVGVNNAGGMKKAVSYLFDLGHRRLAFVNGPKNQRDAEERERGFREAFQERGYAFEERLLLRSEFAEKTGEEAWKLWSKIRPLPTAFVCGDDDIAYGLIQAARKDGVECPRDISVTGFDNDFLSGKMLPSLTTVSQPVEQMGAMAVQMVLRKREAGASGAQGPEQLSFEPELVIRESARRVRAKESST